MEPPIKKNKNGSEQPHVCDKIKDALKIMECPVCLEVIQEPPIYICENPQGHSICCKCHATLNEERKPCPVCRKPLADRINLALENMVEVLPQTCKFEGCEFKASGGAEMKKHQDDDCENRYVPCAYCDDEVGMKYLAQHITGKHKKKQMQLDTKGGGIPLTCQKQTVMKNETNEQNPKFLFNWSKMDADTYMFWISFIGPKTSAKNIRYTFKVRKEENTKEYLLESTIRCAPCDFSHEKVKNMRSAVILGQELIEDAKHKYSNKIYYDLTIHEP